MWQFSRLMGAFVVLHRHNNPGAPQRIERTGINHYIGAESPKSLWAANPGIT
jgi:hypothetical protein